MPSGSCRRSSTATALPAEKEKCSKSSTGGLTSALREEEKRGTSARPSPPLSQRRRLSALQNASKTPVATSAAGPGCFVARARPSIVSRPVDRPKPAPPGPPPTGECGAAAHTFAARPRRARQNTPAQPGNASVKRVVPHRRGGLLPEIRDHLHRILEPWEQTWRNQRAIAQFLQTSAQHGERAPQVAAVDTRHVTRLGRLQGAGIVPIVKVPAVSFQSSMLCSMWPVRSNKAAAGK